ncbi:hypothetical protein K488DRAFT_69317 [Vararia minispora EC-137]|uniref:Uncharacterized protein n=1 Tax=Vararia minispora EC-137 TaxID=1314806 RepID=A0ACB8QRD5_9AGAM|nr:hypothetical protein K488DRAFT_69317 [Vararia minispora EC-137]
MPALILVATGGTSWSPACHQHAQQQYPDAGAPLAGHGRDDALDSYWQVIQNNDPHHRDRGDYEVGISESVLPALSVAAKGREPLRLNVSTPLHYSAHLLSTKHVLSTYPTVGGNSPLKAQIVRTMVNCSTNLVIWLQSLVQE